jgi:hypothetical protein
MRTFLAYQKTLSKYDLFRRAAKYGSHGDDMFENEL